MRHVSRAVKVPYHHRPREVSAQVYKGAVLTAILSRLGEHAPSATVESSFCFLLAAHSRRQSCEVVSWTQGSVIFAMVHVCHLGFHLRSRDHGHVLNTERLEDVLLHVVVQLLSSHPLKGNARPVYADLFPKSKTVPREDDAGRLSLLRTPTLRRVGTEAARSCPQTGR